MLVLFKTNFSNLTAIKHIYIVSKIRSSNSCSGNTFVVFRLCENRGFWCPSYFVCPFILQWDYEEIKSNLKIFFKPLYVFSVAHNTSIHLSSL